MRIIDTGTIRYKDYYDGLQAPQDSLIYTRDTLIIEHNIPTLNDLIKEYFPYPMKVIGFCGYIYLVQSDGYISNGKYVTNGDTYYSPEDIINNVSQGERYVTDRWKNRVLKLSNPYKEDHSLFHLFKVPSFLYIHRTGSYVGQLITNPCLKDLQFYKVKDAYQTYQELDMYIGGVLANTEHKKPNTGDDTVILKSKGFDVKTSFRMISPGKKYKRRTK